VISRDVPISSSSLGKTHTGPEQASVVTDSVAAEGRNAYGHRIFGLHTDDMRIA
jgi:hypothetical protein